MHDVLEVALQAVKELALEDVHIFGATEQEQEEAKAAGLPEKLLTEEEEAKKLEERGRANFRNSLLALFAMVRHRLGTTHPCRLFIEGKLVHPDHVLLYTNPSISSLRRRPKAVRSRQKINYRSLRRALGRGNL